MKVRYTPKYKGKEGMVTKTISLPEPLAKEMVNDAKVMKLNFSEFIRQLFAIWKEYKDSKNNG